MKSYTHPIVESIITADFSNPDSPILLNGSFTGELVGTDPKAALYSVVGNAVPSLMDSLKEVASPCSVLHVDPFLRDLQRFADRLSYALGVTGDEHDYGAQSPSAWNKLEEDFPNEAAATCYGDWIRQTNPHVVPIVGENRKGTYSLILAAGHFEYNIFSHKGPPSLDVLCQSFLVDEASRFITEGNLLKSLVIPFSLKENISFNVSQELIGLWERQLERVGFDTAYIQDSSKLPVEITQTFLTDRGYDSDSYPGSYSNTPLIVKDLPIKVKRQLEVDSMEAYRFVGIPSLLDIEIMAQWTKGNAAIFVNGVPSDLVISPDCSKPSDALNAYLQQTRGQGLSSEERNFTLKHVPLDYPPIPPIHPLARCYQALQDKLGDVLGLDAASDDKGNVGVPPPANLQPYLMLYEHEFRHERSAHIHAEFLRNVYPQVDWITQYSSCGMEVRATVGMYSLPFDYSPSSPYDVASIVDMNLNSALRHFATVDQRSYMETKDNKLLFLRLPDKFTNKGLEQEIIRAWEFERLYLNHPRHVLLHANLPSGSHSIRLLESLGYDRSEVSGPLKHPGPISGYFMSKILDTDSSLSLSVRQIGAYKTAESIASRNEPFDSFREKFLSFSKKHFPTAYNTFTSQEFVFSTGRVGWFPKDLSPDDVSYHSPLTHKKPKMI